MDSGSGGYWERVGEGFGESRGRVGGSRGMVGAGGCTGEGRGRIGGGSGEGRVRVG